MLLNVNPEELIALRAVVRLGKLASHAFPTRNEACREIVKNHWEAFRRIEERINHLEDKREMGQIKKGKRYLHVSIDDGVLDRVGSYLLHLGGGKVRPGALGSLVEKALESYLAQHHVVLSEEGIREEEHHEHVG